MTPTCKPPSYFGSPRPLAGEGPGVMANRVHRSQPRRRPIRDPHHFQRTGSIDGNPDEATHSINAIVATERPVTIWDSRSRRYMMEILLMRGGQFPSWCPLLESHQSWTLNYVLGSVVGMKRSGRVARAEFRFAQDDDYVEPIWRKVRDKHIRGVSIGGRRVSYIDIEPGESANIFGRRFTAGRNMPLRVTTNWIARETSIVIFAADIDSMTT
ncbi:hypothetical protein [Roseiconus lacunae]|uniref:Uncharacterized protein n=1 Tax=Roseiconus lacunae TaxID=2605694 RepID=A0ABT7PH76_9BACT|nr:hypothetical protein [Roseiconus lacunae]MDM4015842.1 hypothetical protein [Roseiconus lacunae]